MKFKEMTGAAIMLLVAAVFMILTIEDTLGNSKARSECEDKHPHTITKIIKDECYYSTEFGWIKSGKVILKPMKRNRGA